ncbi:hypothetical protein HK096_003167 [Nowakowskiella sp. JEL0078]|nr:hypothetical protein HK096_003167 [Nowakowskiella sp. JEL0078]
MNCWLLPWPMSSQLMFASSETQEIKIVHASLKWRSFTVLEMLSSLYDISCRYRMLLGLLFGTNALSYIHSACRTLVLWLKTKVLPRKREQRLINKQNIFTKFSTQFWSLFIEEDFWNESNELSDELPKNVEFVVVQTNSKGEPEKAVPLWRASAPKKLAISTKAKPSSLVTYLPDFKDKFNKSRDSAMSKNSIDGQSTTWDTNLDDYSDIYEATTPLSTLSETFNAFHGKSWIRDQSESPTVPIYSCVYDQLIPNSGEWELLSPIDNDPDLVNPRNLDTSTSDVSFLNFT